MSHHDRSPDARLSGRTAAGRVTWPDLLLAAGIAVALYAIGIVLYLQMTDDDPARSRTDCPGRVTCGPRGRSDRRCR